MRADRIDHEFVDLVPEQLAGATLYISVKYAMAIHLCLCGCGERVVTPLSPTDWRLTYDGESVSLDPSIGNWNFPCRSHYVIKRSHVIWAPRWSQAEIAAGRRRDVEAKRRYYGIAADGRDEAAPPSTSPARAPRRLSRWLARIRPNGR